MHFISPGYHWLFSEDGQLERQVAATKWPRLDHAEIRRRRIHWKSGPHSKKSLSTAPGLLERFIALGDASDERILAFARKWGCLGVARKPKASIEFTRHDDRLKYPLRAPKGWGSSLAWLEEDRDDRSGSEPIHVWRYWARQLGAALRVGSRLSERVPPDPTDFEYIVFGSKFNKQRFAMTFFPCTFQTKLGRWVTHHAWTRQHDRLLQAWQSGNVQVANRISEELGPDSLVVFWRLWRHCTSEFFDWEKCSARACDFLNSCIKIAGIGLVLDKKTQKLEISTRTLFAGLVWLAANAYSRSEGLGICSECGTTFTPDRKPRSGSRNFCPKCGRRAAVKQATRDYRRRIAKKDGPEK